MTIAAHYPREKVPDEIRECGSCHLKVIARGDQHGWKGVDAGGGVLMWFCDKSICQQQRDEFISRRQREMILEQQQQMMASAQKPVEVLTDTEAEEEEQRLKARLMALRTRKRQVSAETALEVANPTEPESVKKPKDSGLFDGMTVHQTRDGFTSLCGEDGALFAIGEDLPDGCVPCVDCSEIFSAHVQAVTPSPVGVDSGLQEPPGASAGVYNPEEWMVDRVSSAELGKTPQVDLDQMPQFTQELIQKINEGGYDGGYVLIPPSAYPDLNLEVMDPERLRSGINKMFEESSAPLEVDNIKRARRGEEFKGVVFSLVAVPVKPKK